MRILVVEDESDIVEMLEYNLEKEGYKVKTEWPFDNRFIDEDEYEEEDQMNQNFSNIALAYLTYAGFAQ